MAAPASNLKQSAVATGTVDPIQKAEKKIGDTVEGIVPTLTQSAKRVKKAFADIPGFANDFATRVSQTSINTTPKPKEVEKEEPLGTEDYERDVNPLAKITGFGLSNKQKRKVMRNGYSSSQLFTGMQKHVIKIYSGDEVYDLSIRDKSNISMYENDKPNINKEQAVFINRAPTIAIRHSEVVRTLSEFNQNYLYWMNDIQPQDENIKQRRRDIKNLFIFIFNNNNLYDVTTSFAKKLQRIAHTTLSTEDKLPCNDEKGIIYNDFLKSLHFRLKQIDIDLERSQGVAGGHYIEQKFTLKKGLEDLIRIMEGGYARSCLRYEYGNPKDYKPLMDLAEQNRIMRIFKKFYLDERPFIEKGQLQEYMYDKKSFPGISPDKKQESFDALYNNIIQQLRERDMLQIKLTHATKINETLEQLLEISIQISDLKQSQLISEDKFHIIEARFFADRLIRQYGVLEKVLEKVEGDNIKDALYLTKTLIQYSGQSHRNKETIRTVLEELRIIQDKYRNKPEEISKSLLNLTEEAIKIISGNDKAPEFSSSDREKANSELSPRETSNETAAVVSVLASMSPQKGGKYKSTPEQKVKALFNPKYDNTETKLYCDSMLTLLLIDLKRQMDEFDVDKFLKKVGTTIGDVKGVCPAVFHILKVLVDKGSEQVIEDDVYIFSPQQHLEYADDTMARLEQKFSHIFDEQEKGAFEKITPIRFYRRTPQEYRGLLGDCSYFITGKSNEEEPELRGVETEMYEEPVYMTADEKRLMMKGGIPMGALLALYFTALAMEEKSDFVS
jgi:hypothetical protein